MSQADGGSSAPIATSKKKVPDWIAKAVLGVALGAGVIFLVMQYYSKPPQPAPSPPPDFDTGAFLGAPGGGPDAGIGAPPVKESAAESPDAAVESQETRS